MNSIKADFSWERKGRMVSLIVGFCQMESQNLMAADLVCGLWCLPVVWERVVQLAGEKVRVLRALHVDDEHLLQVGVLVFVIPPALHQFRGKLNLTGSLCILYYCSFPQFMLDY